MTNFTELQQYLLNRMQVFERHDQVGISSFTWATDFPRDDFQKDLPSTFLAVAPLQFPEASAWADVNNSIIVTWRNLDHFQSPVVNLYKFDDKAHFLRELDNMIKDPNYWLSLGEK